MVVNQMSRPNSYRLMKSPITRSLLTAALVLVGTLLITTMQRLGKTRGMVANAPALPGGGHAAPGVCTRATAGQLRPPARRGLMAGGNARAKALGASWL